MLRPIRLSSEEVKTLISDYQECPTSETFSLLLLKFDKLLVYIILKMRKKLAWLREVELEDLYHTAILGFAIALKKIPKDCKPSKVPAYISAYVKAEIKKMYRYLCREEAGLGEPPDIDTVLEPVEGPVLLDGFEMALDSANLSEMEKECLRKKFYESKSLNEIAVELGIKVSRVYRRVRRGLRKLKEWLSS